jgi:hypothetical protein
MKSLPSRVQPIRADVHDLAKSTSTPDVTEPKDATPGEQPPTP